MEALVGAGTAFWPVANVCFPDGTRFRGLVKEGKEVGSCRFLLELCSVFEEKEGRWVPAKDISLDWDVKEDSGVFSDGTLRFSREGGEILILVNHGVQRREWEKKGPAFFSFAPG